MKSYCSQIIENIKWYRHIGILLLLVVWLPCKVNSQTYSSTINYGHSTISFEVKLVQEYNQTKVLYSSLDMNAYEIPCQNVMHTKDKLQFSVISDYFTYAYDFIMKSQDFRGSVTVYSNETGKSLNTFKTNLNLNNNIEDAILKKKSMLISLII